MNDVTHLGIYDIAMLSNIPNLVYLAPTCKEEYLAMVEWSMSQRKYPVAIRVPGNGVVSNPNYKPIDFDNLNKYSVTKKAARLQFSDSAHSISSVKVLPMKLKSSTVLTLPL